MNGYLLLAAVYLACGIYEFCVALSAFFSKCPKIPLGCGAFVTGFSSCFLAIWVSTFENDVPEILIAFIVTMIVMLMACLTRTAKKESR